MSRAAIPQETCSRTYGGPRTPADPVIALELVITWIHTQWSAFGNPPADFPSEDMIRFAW